MTRLYLVGTHHDDMKGQGRLEKFLRFTSPEVIGLEATEDDFNEQLQKHQELGSLLNSLGSELEQRYGPDVAMNMKQHFNMSGYESWVSFEFSKNNPQTKIICCDKYNPREARKVARKIVQYERTKQSKIEGINETQDANPIDELANTDFQQCQEITDKSYYDDSIETWKRDMQIFKIAMLNRDEEAEKSIRKVVKEANCMVYIGGISHIFGNYPNLYEKLKDLSPSRIRLVELDKFKT